MLQFVCKQFYARLTQAELQICYLGMIQSDDIPPNLDGEQKPGNRRAAISYPREAQHSL
ncbi:protein of unknown function (plasmid) [Caballeronia sp. S22]